MGDKGKEKNVYKLWPCGKGKTEGVMEGTNTTRHTPGRISVFVCESFVQLIEQYEITVYQNEWGLVIFKAVSLSFKKEYTKQTWMSFPHDFRLFVVWSSFNNVIITPFSSAMEN